MKPTIKELRQKLEQLEARVKELEQRPVYVPQPVWVQPYWPTTTPNVPWNPPWVVTYGSGTITSDPNILGFNGNASSNFCTQ